MKKAIRYLALLTAILMLACTLGCSTKREGPEPAEPPAGQTRINVFGTYFTGKSLSPRELHINNDYSGFVRYLYTGSTSDLEKLVSDLLDQVNRLRYGDKRFEKGDRVFWTKEGDIKTEEDGARYVTVRFTNLTYCHDTYYKVRTVAEHLKEAGTADFNYAFKDFSNPDIDYNLVSASEKDQEKLKIWHLQELAAGVKVSIEGGMRYFYDGGNKTVKREGDAVIFENEDVYFLYTDARPVDRTLLIVGIVSGVLVAAAIVVFVLTLRPKKKKK